MSDDDTTYSDHSLGFLALFSNILFVYIPTLIKTFLNIIIQTFSNLSHIFPDIINIVMIAFEKIKNFVMQYLALFRL